MDNGVSVCAEHHLAAEMTTISCDKLRELAGIQTILLPEHLTADQPYDKWGNPILPNGMRMRGELYQEEPCQKMLAAGNVLALFTEYIKYPRTFHLPWSPGRSDDDKVLPNCSQFEGKEVVVTIKMDGENTTMYNNYLHARSLEYHSHPSRSRIKQLHATIAHEIPEGWRICGENLFAKHSIHYSNLDSHFNMFSIWNERNFCLNWEETKEWATLLGLSLVPVLYQGIWDEALIKKLYSPVFDNNQCEGYVIRVADQFHYRRFKECVGKFVRASHVTTNEHWLQSEVVPNLLRK
ncbi:MAG TPA: RNA ligase family protein [Anaerovoracaceae bacterium]|nr:RNA ligase family protein [Anaerovoracaceae bacterium]